MNDDDDGGSKKNAVENFAKRSSVPSASETNPDSAGISLFECESVVREMLKIYKTKIPKNSISWWSLDWKDASVTWVLSTLMQEIERFLDKNGGSCENGKIELFFFPPFFKI